MPEDPTPGPATGSAPGAASSPTWYDVLGVQRDASAEEIKAAWRDATDRFEPGAGSGQFKMFNEAAGVLLDPEARRRYDASLPPEPPPTGTESADATTSPVGNESHEQAGPDFAEPTPVPVADPGESVEHRTGSGATRSRTRRRGRLVSALGGLSVLTLAVLGVLALALVVLATVLGVRVHQAAGALASREEVPAAAERAAKAMLSYDYRTLPADRERAGGFLTPKFKKSYLANFALLEKQKDGTAGAAVQTKTKVSTSVLGSGVMDAEDKAARVLVFVNQISSRPGADPQIFQNRVAMKMEKVDGRWLVDDLKSY